MRSDLVTKRYKNVDLAANMRVKEGIEGFIEVVASFGGKRKSRSFPLVSSLSERLAWQHQAVEAMRLQTAPEPKVVDDGTIRAGVAAYLRSQHGARRRRAESYLRYWVQWYGDLQRSDLTLQQVQVFFEHVTPMTGKAFSASSKNKLRTYLLNVWRYTDGKRHTCPALDVPLFPEPVRESSEITPEMALGILGAMSDSANRARLGLLFTTGMRPGELDLLRPASFHLEDETPWVAIPTAKGGRPRVVALPPLGVQYAEDFLRHAAWEGRSNLMRDMQAAAKRAGYDVRPLDTHPCGRKRHAIKPYAFRHAYAMNMRRAGADIADIQDALGHASVTTSRKYAQAIPERQAAVAKAMWEKVGMV
jgi:integrase